MKVYICGDYSKEEEFEYAEKRLRKRGHIPVNPIMVRNALPEEINNSDFTVIAYELIRICDAVYLMDGWEDNLFSRMELAHAKRNEKGILKQ